MDFQTKGGIKKWETKTTFGGTCRSTKASRTVDYELPYSVLGILPENSLNSSYLGFTSKLVESYKFFNSFPSSKVIFLIAHHKIVKNPHYELIFFHIFEIEV